MAICETVPNCDNGFSTCSSQPQTGALMTFPGIKSLQSHTIRFDSNGMKCLDLPGHSTGSALYGGVATFFQGIPIHCNTALRNGQCEVFDREVKNLCTSMYVRVRSYMYCNTFSISQLGKWRLGPNTGMNVAYSSAVQVGLRMNNLF